MNLVNIVLCLITFLLINVKKINTFAFDAFSLFSLSLNHICKLLLL